MHGSLTVNDPHKVDGCAVEAGVQPFQLPKGLSHPAAGATKLLHFILHIQNPVLHSAIHNSILHWASECVTPAGC